MTFTPSVQQLDKLRSELQAKRDLGIKWRDIAADYRDVPAGTLCSILKGREPRHTSVRTALGLPALALAPVCACGQVHTSKSCPNRPKPPRKPRTDWRGLAKAASWAAVVLMNARER